MSHNQYIYCFSTTVKIDGVKSHNDYAVYKIGKTTQSFKDRIIQHGIVVDKVLFKERVYDCNTTERDLIELLKKNPKLVLRRDVGTLIDADGSLIKTKKKGLEYFEGRYSDIKPVLEDVVSEITQGLKPRDMDVDNQCPVCSRTFGDKGGLKKHLHTHDTDKEKTFKKTYKKEEASYREPSKRIKEQKRIISYAEKSSSKSASPKVLSPKSASPKVLSPKSASPKVLSPKSASPKVLSPKSASPKVLSPNSASPKVLSPKSVSPKVLNVRRIKRPVYTNNLKKNKLMLHKEDYKNDTNLSKEFLKLFEELIIKDDKRKRDTSSNSKSSNKRPLKKIKFMT